jgi:hypothetical protein
MVMIKFLFKKCTLKTFGANTVQENSNPGTNLTAIIKR